MRRADDVMAKRLLVLIVDFANRTARIVSLCLLLLVTSCAVGPRTDLPYNAATFGPPDVPKTPTVSEAYRLGALDTIVVTVFQVPDLSGEHQIDPSGVITMPLIGDVIAQGLTPRELASRLREKLGARYLQSPEVQVAVKEAVSERITVEGAVNSPGVFPITGSTSLIQAVALAHGISENGNPRRVVVFRMLEGRRQAAAFDLSAVRSGKQPDPKLYGNDVIVVDGSNLRKGYRDLLQSIPLLAIFGVL